jgi:Flp pilus assembly protein TadB
VIPALALSWGIVAAMPCVALAQRATVAGRIRPPAPAQWSTTRMASVRRRLGQLRPIAICLHVGRAPARRRRRRRRDDALARELASAVDLIGVAVAAGCNPYLAVELGARWSPPLVRAALERVLGACRVGQSFDAALSELGQREPRLLPLTTALRTSARLGTPAAPALGRVAAEVRADLRRRAEARARTVPVRLCFPLVGCILPAFALLTVVPVVLGGLRR